MTVTDNSPPPPEPPTPGPGAASTSPHLRDQAQHLARAARAAADRSRLHRSSQAHLNAGAANRFTVGQRAADRVAQVLGSWRFLIVQTAVLAGWVALNLVAWFHHWDPYPFILLNLMLSFQAAYAAPVLLMSSNRQAAVDRAQAQHDYLVNERSEAAVEELVSLVKAQLAQGAEILDRVALPGRGAPARPQAPSPGGR